MFMNMETVSRRPATTRWWPLAVFLLGLAGTALAEAPTAAFAEREAIVLPRCAGLRAGERVWFRLTKESRLLAAGSATADGAAVLRIPVSLPGLKGGLTMRLELTLRQGGEDGEILFEGALWTFAQRPFEGSRNPVAPRALFLWDPGQSTSKAFAAIGIDFEPVASLDAVAELHDALLVIGEGISLADERGLREMLDEAMTRGNDILLLAPEAGTLHPAAWRRLAAGDLRALFPPPKPAAAETGPDSAALLAAANAGQASFRLCAERDEAVFVVARDAGVSAVGWESATSGARFRACGVPIVAVWDSSPAARWLLVEMLEHYKTKGKMP
jgi:hypothetical protein